MKIRNKRRICALMLFVLLTMANASSAMARVVIYGSETKGYMVFSSSLRTNKTTYDDSKLNAICKGYASSGAKLWNDTKVVTFTKSKKSPNKLKQYTNYNTSTKAYHRMLEADKNGKVKKFEINYNLKYMNGKNSKANKKTACHEFGHAIGLADLYNSSNQKQIMYGMTPKAASKPSAKDIKGAKYATRK